MGKINEKKFEPTLDEPTSDHAIEFQDKFDKTMTKHHINLNEVDKLLNEKEQSLKKKIFNLSKMEALVHSDPKLSAVYDEMAENGEEKYGYHYNETIMNIIFNDYILNSPKYLQKYKQAVPKEKKRRDKSGINQLRKDAEEIEKRREELRKQKQAVNETNTFSAGAYGYETPAGFKDDVENVSKEIDTEKEFNDLEKVETALPGKEKRAYGKYSPAGKDVSSAVASPEENKEIKKPFYPGGEVTAPILNGLDINELQSPSQKELQPQDNLNENLEQMEKDKQTDIEKPEDQIEETTSAGSAAGASTSYVGYAGPSAWGSGDLMKTGKKGEKDKESFWKGGKVIQESNYLTDPEVFEQYAAMLNENFDNFEAAKNMAQQISHKEGVAQHVNQIADDNYQVSDWFDADTTIVSYDNGRELSENNVNEHHAETREDKIHFLLQNIDFADGSGYPVAPVDWLNSLDDSAIDDMYTNLENLKFNKELQLNEKAKSKAQQRFMGMVHAYQKGELKDSEVSDTVKKAAKSMTDKEAEDFASTKYDKLPEKVDETMIDNQEDSMKMQPPVNVQSGDLPIGMQTSGPMNENKNKDIMSENENFLNKVNEYLDKIENYHKKLQDINEDRKPSTLVMKDRLGNENDKNFKADLKHSGTKEIIDTTKELEWKDQQTDVPKDPQKLGKDLEKQALKNTDKGTSLKNVGNSANNKGDEIPKRNLTDEETNEVDLYRKGLGDVNFDNEPDERYMERMKRDMGEEEFKKRGDRMEFEAEKPMYNKDTQPMEDGIEKDQFDKNKSTWNERMGINEIAMTGKYIDELGKTRFFDFNTVDIQEVKELKKGAFFKLNLDGLGNTYNSRVQVNEGVSDAINDWNFYTDGNEVFVHKPVQNLNESEQKEESGPINEQFKKMQHLLGYKPQEFINTKKNKL